MDHQYLLDKALPFRYLWDPESRIHYLYLLSSLAMALVFYAYFRQKNLKNFFAYFFNFKVLFHPSSRNDIYLFIFNFWLKVFIVIPLLFTEVKLIYYIKNTLSSSLPSYNPIYLNPLIYSILYTFIFFIIADFSRFLLHFSFHRNAILWEIHKVHHSAKVLTPLTLYRTHPIESVLSLVRQIVVIGLVAGIFTFLFTGNYEMVTIFGVQIFGFLFNFFGSNLRHSHVPISFGHIVESIIISPLMHQTHHSINKVKNTKNFGSCLAIWDILYGSYLRPDFKPIRFGLSKNQRKKTFLSFVLNPLVYFQVKR